MRVYVFRSLLDAMEGLAAVIALLNEDAHDVNAVDVLWVGDNARVIHARGVVRVPLSEGDALIVGAEDATGLVGCFDLEVDDVGVGRGDCDSYAANIFLHAYVYLVPGRASVCGAVESAFGSAIDHGVDVAAALPG